MAKLLSRVRAGVGGLFCVLYVTAGLFGLSGCATYTTPGERADLSKVTDIDIEERLSREPAAVFPVRLAYVRVQGSGYRSYTNRGYGHGNYSVVTAREVETEEHLRRLGAMQGVAGVAGLNRLVIPVQLKSNQELREAAASLHADLLLVYTIDTVFRVKDHDVGPLGPVTLGLLHNQEAKITSTASAAVIDVRTGFVYGLAESTAKASGVGSHWNSAEVVDESRVEAEKKAFDGLVGELEKVWGDIVTEHGG